MLKKLVLALLVVFTPVRSSRAAEATPEAQAIHVDPRGGDDRNDGVAAPVKTIARGIRLAQPGDTVHLAPVRYFESADLSNKHGEPGKPITLDGHGAVLDGTETVLNGSGNGPVDAFVHALREHGGFDIHVQNYHEHGVGAGEDATAVAYVQLRIGSDRTVYGVGFDVNIVTATLQGPRGGNQGVEVPGARDGREEEAHGCPRSPASRRHVWAMEAGCHDGAAMPSVMLRRWIPREGSRAQEPCARPLARGGFGFDRPDGV